MPPTRKKTKLTKNKRDSYYATSGRSPPSVSGSTLEAATKSLSTLFDKFRAATDDSNTISAEGSMAYLVQLGTDFEDCSMFVPLCIVSAPCVGEVERKPFIDGWLAESRTSGVPLYTLEKQKDYIGSLVARLGSDIQLFKRVYRHAFVASKERVQKVIAIDTALELWKALFRSPAQPWVGASGTNWLDLWEQYLTSKGTKGVNKDLWNQTWELWYRICKDGGNGAGDETLSFWNEDGAWPSVIDGFVEWVREKKSDAMDTD
jgi:DCN1-like protein 1/2